MSISRKFQRSKSKYTLSQKIISAVTAAGFIMQPIAGFAHNIVASNDFGTKVETNGKVTDIWAGKVVGNTAINKFDKFGLNANEIANMYFGQTQASHDADNLVNFVNDRIDINGTVNAIKGSEIGGNLFFLSKEGMAVGKSGVINTGSLYVMTPTPDFMEAVQTVGTEAPAEDANKYLGYITNITDPTKANAWEIIPVNTSGTITVLGKVNATNEVQMRAAKIGVGKNVSGELTDDEGTVIMEADAANKEAYIKTGITNFADIVNIKNADGTAIITESGLTGDLQATQTGSGDIVLSAYVDGATEKNDLEELPVVGATLGPIAETVENTFVEQDFNASVDVYGTVATGVETTEKKGNININATAVNSNAAVDKSGNYIDNDNTDVAQLANVKAEVNIDGTVQAADNVTVKAEAINRYIDNSGAFAKANIAIASGTPITGDVAYSVLNTEANVNITSDGSVESENGNVDIDAKAETLAASAASVTALKFKAAGGTTGANVPAVSVLYTGADNKANVTVEGNVNAAKDISIDADADMKVDAENKMGIKGKMGNQFVVGVTVAGAENSASVDIKDEITAGNDLSVNANATSDFTSGTSIKAPEASAMAVAVNVTDFNSNANVNIDTDLTAGNDLTVKADNIITDDNVIAESTIGSGKYVSAATQVVTGHVEQKKGEVKEWIGTLAGKISAKLQGKLSGSDDADIPSLQLSEIFKAGATVNYSGQTHGSNVTIGENTTLNAGKKMDIDALTKIEDAHITATGTTASYNDAYPAEATLNAAVLVNNMDNSSSVVVEDAVTDEKGEHKATISATDGVDINASTRFEYNRIKNMIQDVEDAAAQISDAVSGLDSAIKSDFDKFLDNLDAQIGAWEGAFKTADETLATSDSGVLAIGEAATAGLQVLTALNNLNTMLDSNEGSQVAADVKATIQGASDILTGALAFADPNSYGNFAAASASKGSSGDTSAIAGHHPSAINGAGTVMVNTIDSVSKVEIGSNSVIESNGKVNLNAENYMKDVSLGGLNTVPLTNSGGGTVASIGATVNYSDFNTDTIVAVNDGASISGGDINIAGSNEIDHVSVAGGAGMGPSDETGSKGIVLNGMLSFVNGSSDILTVVDDGASLTAEQKEYTETVENESGSTEETKTSTGNISISGHNNTNIVNVAAGLNLGSGSGAIGMGLAYNDFAVKNIAGVADVSEQINALYTTKEHYTDDNGEDAVRYVVDENKVKELNDKLSNNYTASKADNGSISAYGFNVDAATEGSIQSVSVAASASKNDDTGETSFFGKIKGSISNTENKLLGSGGKLDTVTGRIFGTESGKANDFFNMGKNTHGGNGGIKINNESNGKGGFMPSFSIAGSGSVSLNVLDNATEAIVDNAKITMNDGNINVTARDALYAGAYSGAAGMQWKSGGSSSDKAVGFAGAAGVNDIDNVVKAVVKNSTIENAGKFNTMALSGGEQLALGLGLAVEKTGSTSGYSGNAAVSVNLIDHEVEALHENNTVEKAEDVNVSAYARDIENTGGGSLGAGQQKVGVGATVGVAMLNNTISAGIKGGEYKYVGNVDVEALNALQNITVGIAAGLTIPSDGNAASANVEGAGVYNEVHNTTNAFITGNSDTDKVIITTVKDDNETGEVGNVNVTAQDVAVVKTYEDILTEGIADGKQEIAKRMGKDFDITGKTELAGVEMDDVETELNKNKQETETKESVKLDKTTGSSIITVAGGLAATTGKGAGGAAVAITDIENTYTADVKYADITADELDVDAGSNSNIVTVAGGIAAANKGSGVGSVSWNDVINTANVNIANSDIRAQQTTATAANQAQIVSVGGQISGAGKAAVGATLSYVGLDNTTKVNISTTDFDERTANEGTNVTAEANNTSDSYNIGAGVSAGGTASVSGTVVVTQTKGTAGAVMDAVTINNAKKVMASAIDDTDILSVIGGINISGKVAAGAGVSYTEIGGVSDDKEKAEQHVTAEIKNNSTINTDGADSTVEVKAKDEARVINVAIGVGGAGNVAVQGASATTLINKTTSAEIANTDIDKDGGTSTEVTVAAQNVSEITGSADVAAVAGSGAGVGAGISVNRIIQQTNASVNGGTMNVNNLTVKADAAPQITNIGVGIGVAGSGAGVTGSVAVNMIENDVTAHIGSGATIVADGTVGVVATSDEQIANYAGQASVAGTGAAVGLSVSYNELTGNTTAIIGGDTTSVSASGKGYALKVKDSVDDNSILDNVVDKNTFDSQNTLGDDRIESEYKGVAVSASSTHAIKSFIINAGVAGTGAAVNGTVNVNQIGGSTKAAITGANINKDNANAAGNVNVIAHDYTNSAGMVGTASITGTGAGIGLGSDTNTVSREVTAEVSGKAKDNKNIINAADFNVDANAKQGISSLTVSAAGAGIGVGLSNATSVALLKGKTTAKVNNANITASSVNVAANHTGKLNTMGTVLGVAGAGAGVSVGVSVLNENSETVAEVSGGDITITNDAESNNIKVKAANSTKVDYNLYTASAGLAGVAGAIGVSNINSRVKTNVADVVMSDSKADDINIGAENAINFTNTSGSGAGGAVGFGGGVAVNTVDSQVTTTVTNAQLNAANDINVTAQETRKVNQMTVNAGAGLVAGGANVMITNVGSAVADSYGSGLQTDNDGQVQDNSGINTATIFDKANEAVEGNKLKDGDTYGVQVNNVPDVKATKGTDGASVVEVNINESTLNAGNKVTAEAVADTNVTMNTVQASGAAVISATGTVGILDVNRNSVVNINNTTINAKDLAVSTTQKGTSNLSIYQGNVGGAGSIGAAYGSASSTGVNNISVSGSTLNVDSNVDINANDESKTAVDAFGVTLAGGGAASIIVAQGSNNSSTNIDVNDTDIYAGEDIDIHAERQAKDEKGNKVDSLSVSAKAMSGGLMFAGAGVGATANELGKVGVTVADDSNFTAGKAINLTALNAPSVSASTGALSASMIASGAITVAEANIGSEDDHLETIVEIGDDNSFTAESLTAEAEVNAAQNVEMNGMSISAALWPTGAVQANVGGANAYSDVTVTVGENVFKGNGTEAAVNGIDLNISGSNSVTQNVTAKGISVSTFVASGTNAAESTADLITSVTASGSNEGSDVDDLTVRADSNADITTTAEGDGGGLIDVSPDAASVDNNYIADTDVTIGGNWNTNGAVEATAINGGDINLLSDALRAAVVGGSGVWLHNNIDNQADVNVNGAVITSNGRQAYTAQNIADYDGDIKGSGYGGISINGTQLRDTFNYGANVNIENSSLHGTGDEGNITAQALTEGNISSYNLLKSAGVIPVSIADSEHKVTYDNAVDIKNSKLITDKKNQDITLVATDNTMVDLNTTADTQGGLVGAASAAAKNDFNRYNDVTVDDAENTYIESANDVNLYAGVDANGEYSSLNLNVIADAYNKTVLPLATAPSVTNNMSQNNKVTIEGDVASVRHINAKAVKGNTTIAKSANEYKNIGSGGKGSVTTTAGGKDEGTDEVYNNSISVSGDLTAGIHNRLDIDIDGETKTEIVYKDDQGTVDESKSGVSYDNVTVDVEQDWFDKNKITPSQVKIINNLKEEYNKLAAVISQYPVGSKEYTNLNEAMNALENQMKAAGFFMQDNNGNYFGEALDEKSVLGIELPDIVVSGGNINFETDALSGDGNITAQGAPQINISNDSDLYLKVNDITIQDNGGIVRLNGSEMVDGKLGEFTGSVSVPVNDGKPVTPEINITSTSASSFAGNKLAQPDIAIYGDIVNAVGDINISSSFNDITINENAQLSARNITLSAEQGSVTQNSTEGIYNVGGDPVSQYQFGEDVAVKLQKYVNEQLKNNPNWTISFNSREEYINWLKNTVGVTDAELGNTQINEQAGISAGENVYINALDVNINALVQAGYGKYLSTLGKDAADKIDSLNKTYSGKNFSDSEVLGNSAFMVNKGDKVWDDTNKVWNYQVAVYYNPTTQKLLVDNVTPNGGQIYITGNVASTGNGRLMAMDGTADISVDTTAVKNNVNSVVINNIANKDIEGLISITDTNKSLVTEYKNGQWREYAVGTAVQDRPDWQTGTKTEYAPQEGLSYQYTGGYKSGEINYKSYTKDFLFWTGLKYDQSTTIEDAIEKEGGTADIVTRTEKNEDGKANGSGVFIGVNNNQNGDWSISGSYVEGAEGNQSKVTTDTNWGPPEWLGYIGGYGTIVYEWTTENTTTSSTTSSIKADKKIQIGFLGNGNNSGNISVTSNQNIELAGNISNAEVNGAGRGSVNLTSNSGSVSAIGSANINSNDVNIKAATGVNVNHSAIGDSANINIATNSGDIKFVSSGGDLNVEQAVTGGNAIDATTGSVYLEAQGDILNAATGSYAVKGQRIDLISHTGTIGTKDKALTVLGGSDLYSSDTMASSVNAQAQGDIVLTQFDGNMRLGTIVSEDGDAVLTVNNGSFVDAHPSENSDNSSAQDKIDRWLEAGLISEDDGAGESTASAEQAKAERVNALTDRMEALAAEGEHSVQDYKDAADDFYKDEGISAAKAAYLDAVAKANSKTEGDQTNEGGEINVADAYAKYQAAQKDYFADKGFSEAEQETIINYAEVANSDNYGWSKNQLLYAIQDSVLNTKPGEVQTVETPNVTANNITLNAANGGVGVDGAAQVIGYDKLNDEATLKLLAQAKAGDLTWDEENQQVTIRQQQAITVSVKEQDGTYGKVKVTGKDNVYLAGVKDTELNINGVKTDGDIRLQGDKGVNVDGTLTGEDLTIAGGTGNIMGTGSDKYVTTNISGALDAKAEGSIYISQNGDLSVLAIAAGGLADLIATNNILMSDVEGSTAQGYINAQTLNLTAGTSTAGGSIGTDGTNENAIRVLDNGVVINASATGDIILAGAHGEYSTGSIVLGDIEGANLDVTSISDINLGREDDAATEEDETVNSNINAGTVELTTSSGSITETEGGAVDAETVKAAATQNVVLAGTGNAIDNFVVNGYGADNTLNGNVDLVSTANNENNVVNVEFGKGEVGLTVNNGYVNVSSLGDTSNLNISGGSVTTTGENAGDVTFTSEGSITADTTVNSAADIVMDADGAITNNGALTAQDNVNVNTTEGAIEIGGSVTAEAGNVNVNTESGDVTTNGEVTGNTDVSINSGNGAINIGGSVTATDNDVNITTGSGAISTTGAISGGTNVKVDAGTTGTIDLGGDVTAQGGDVVVTTDDGYIKTTGAVTANNDVEVDTSNGLINLGGLVDAETGFVNVSTDNGSITTGGYVSGHKDVTLDSDGGDIIVGGYTESETQNVTATVKGDGNISFAGTVSASGDVKAEVTGKGDITTGSGTKVSGTDISFTTNVGDITTGSNLTADKNVDLNVNNTGDITFGGDVIANDGNITIDITVNGNLQDAENKDNTLAAYGPEGSEDAGNIIIHLGGKGDVDLYDLYATNAARIDIADGSLTLHEINGELVAMQLRTEGKNMNVENIVAGTQIVLTGSDMTLDQIAQRPDADGMLVVTPNGASEDKPIDNFTIGNITTNAGSGIRFDHLWVNNSDIHIDQGQLWFDKLYVENAAHFSNNEMVAAIYGVPPLRDGSDSVYWNNTAENRPEDNLDMWLNDNGDWMYLRFTDDHIQESNGILLTLDQYDYVYDQRFTAENHLRWQHGRYLDEDWKQAYGYGLSLHNRYGLIDYQEFTETNAAADEVAVEA